MQLRLYLTYLFLAGTLVGLVFSPPVLSIGLIGLAASAVLDPKHGLNPAWRAGLPAALRDPANLGLLALYGLLLAGVWQTYDWPYYLERLRIKVPLLVLPLVWHGLPIRDRLRRPRVVFVLFLSVVLATVLANYAVNATEINDLLRRGQAVPVPRNHIRFSLLVALATLAGLSLVAHTVRRELWWLLVGATLFLFVGQHFLAVRSGLAGAYGGLIVYGIVLAIKTGQYRPVLLGLVLLLLVPVAAYLAVPTFRTKLQYARYELLHRDPTKDTGEYSDAGRLTSLRIGLRAWREAPLLGVGPGNLRSVTDRLYREELGVAKGKRPHNQFVSALAGSGVVGLLVTLAAFAAIIIGYGRWRDPLYAAAFMVLLLSCLVENTLENSVGVSLFALVLLWWRPTPFPSRGRPPSPPAPASTPA